MGISESPNGDVPWYHAELTICARVIGAGSACAANVRHSERQQGPAIHLPLQSSSCELAGNNHLLHTRRIAAGS